MPDRPPVLAIVGPTCTGKTALSVRIAQKCDGEIVACDSRTIYKYMDVGTAKPTKQERANVPHFMFDVVSPDQSYTVAQYKDEATACIQLIGRRNHLPIVVGGTGLYARALLEGLEIPPVPPQPELRTSLQEYADTHGNQKLYERLVELDPITAQRLNPNDRFRIVRAIEVSTVAGKPLSQLARKNKPPFNTLWIGLTVDDRSYLLEAITKRMQEQLDAGLMDEVRSLYERFGCTRALMKAVNYREFIDHFMGKLTLKQAVDECIRHNYQLSRRQLMWFKTNNEINWFAVDRLSQEEIFDRVSELVNQKR
ncbi:MAG TPA: tRNA (adenosine(37)-N6)-dimethylallyltransferase MiaA [Planktothrix sp.]|jgi:tRNA dimethylallyltransferase